MDMSTIRKHRSGFWYFVFASFLFWFYLDYSALIVNKHESNSSVDDSTMPADSLKLNFLPSFPANSHRLEKFPIMGNSADNVEEPNNIESKNWHRPISFPFKGHGLETVDQVSMSDGEDRLENQMELKDVQSENRENTADVESEFDESCMGRYIYVHRLPRGFNDDLIRHCRSLNEWSNMCPSTSNVGLGPRFPRSEKFFANSAWFDTNQFMLEVIFLNRMKQYRCLTRNSSLASAIFVPYYAGLDVARYLWGGNKSMKDSASVSLLKWLTVKPEWKRMWGRDHFMVAGRITWDFRRLTDDCSDWGNQLMVLPEAKNMTMLTIESSPWANNDFAIPYPTYFHPSKDIEVFQWQNRMRRQRRRYLFTFAGAPRPNSRDSVRDEIIHQCHASGRKCRLLECHSRSRGNMCYKPVYLMKMFTSSVFCLQPPGDSYTRRSTFDSIVSGCIPVFFHPGSAYVQYLWHLPKDYEKYSVFIPGNAIKGGQASIERILSRIGKAKVLAMREQVIKLIPRVIYADPRSRLEKLDDAFDITVNGVLERVETIKREIEEGRNSSADVAEEINWKYSLFGTVEKHEWDPYFERH